MSDRTFHEAVPIPAGQAGYLIATAARAPSVHNTQPCRFKVSRYKIELYADLRRKLRVDPLGREMLISCGAAVSGLRLGVRSLGYLPVVELLPDPDRLRLLARVRLGPAQPITAREQEMLQALPHRHTHRGPFEPGPLPAGLLARLQHDALVEGATLALVDRAMAYEQLAAIIGAAGRRQDLDPVSRAEVTGGPPATTAVLLTAGDGRADWLRAGQALHRLLAHAASRWVFASLYTQPLEAVAIRSLIRGRLALPGAPQMLLQLGLARATQATARRPPTELIEP